MRIRYLIILLITGNFLLLYGNCLALSKDSTEFIRQYEDTLKHLQYGRLDIHKTNRQKEEANTCFEAMLQQALKLPNSFAYSFDSLTTVAKLESPDKQFRIINWNLPKADGTQEYFGFIQSMNPKTKKYMT